MHTHTPCAFYYSYTTHCLYSHWTPTGGARKDVELCQSFSSPLSLPYHSAGAAASWTCLKLRGLILQAGVGHFPFWLYSLLLSACSLSTLSLCLHPDTCELQQTDVMASCCGWPGGPSAMLVSVLSKGWAPFKERKHWSSSEWGHLPAPETSYSCRLPPPNARGPEGRPQDAKAMPGSQWCQALRLCSYTGFCFNNWVVGGRWHQSLDISHWRRKRSKSFFLLMSLPILLSFILNK